jgi:hypothetical protein
MTQKLRLIVPACLFIGWIGYLAFLVSITRDPVILSRPQFLVADLYVIAELEPLTLKEGPERPSGKITVKEVAWPKAEASLVSTDIMVRGLPNCEERNGWVGKGVYIVPVTKSGDDYFLTEIPLSPGFHKNAETFNYLRIYPSTPQAREQLGELIAEFHGQ